ncbi:MAG: DinB family protein [Desulfococcaceae bacterium]
MSPNSEHLIRRSQALRALLESAIDQVAELPDWVDQRSPGPDRWSPVQILEHLILAEREMLGFPAPFSERDIERPRIRHRLGRASVLTVLKLGIPVPVPETAMSPKGKTPLHRLRRMIAEIHDWLETEIASEPAETLRSPIFHHPITGPMTLEQALRLDKLHIKTHLRHLDDLITELTA